MRAAVRRRIRRLMEATENVEQTLRSVISQIGGVGADFSPAADLYNELGLDSFRMVEIFMEAERRFGITISEDDYLSLRTLAQFLDLVKRGQKQ
jgi:acyl carrier protein